MAVAKKTVAIIPPQIKYDKHVKVEQKIKSKQHIVELVHYLNSKKAAMRHK